MPKIYLAGKFVDKEQATVSVYDHGLLYGDGVFEGIRQYGGKVFKLTEHLDRLYKSARAIMLEIPMPMDELAKAVNETCAINNLKDSYIRLVVTRGAGSLGLDIRKTSNPQIIIIADKIQLYPEEMYKTGLSIVTASTQRQPPTALNPRIKSLNYLNNVLARIEGYLAGCEEVLMLNHKGEVSECSADNIFLVSDGKVSTPPLDAGILEGITRNTVIDLCAAAKIPCEQVSLTRHDVYTADEVFLTGTAAELAPVIKVDGRSIGSGKPGPVYQKLLTMFREFVAK